MERKPSFTRIRSQREEDQENVDQNIYAQMWTHGQRKRDDDVQSIISSVIDKDYTIEEDMIDLEANKQKYAYKQEIAPLHKPFDQAAPLPSTKVEKKLVDLRKKKRDEIFSKIKERNDALKNVNKLFEPRMELNDCMKYLQSIGVKTDQDFNTGEPIKFKQFTKPNNIIRCRPQFKNDGSLLLLKHNTSKLTLTQIPVNSKIPNEESKHCYQDMSKIIKKHMNLLESSKEKNEIELNRDFKNQVRISEEEKKREDDRSNILGTFGIQYKPPRNLYLLEHHDIEMKDQKFDIHTQMDRYEDNFISKMLQSLKLPIVEFPNSPNDLFKFMEDIAIHLNSKIQNLSSKQSTQENNLQIHKLQQEFYVICLINALYGNPSIHLVQLHYQFNGIRNYDEAKRLYANEKSNKNFIDGYTAFVEKKRRNALSEVIRFICQSEFKDKVICGANPNLDQIYQICLEYLLNGDIKGAVQHLNNFGKYKMAQYIIQSVNSEISKELLIRELRSHSGLYQNFNPIAKEILNFISGQYDFKKNRVHWIRQLCYILLFKANPNEQFEKVLRDFIQEFKSGPKEEEKKMQFLPQGQSMMHQQLGQKKPMEKVSVLFSLIQVYAYSAYTEAIADQEIKANFGAMFQQLLSFRGLNVNEFHENINDHRIQFFVIFIMYQLSRYYSRNRNLYEIKYNDAHIANSHLVKVASKYINQLLREEDWSQAILISLLIPEQCSSIRKKIIFDILIMKGMYQVSHESCKKNLDYLKNDLKVPGRLIHTATAIFYQYGQLYEKAMNEWHEAQNYQMMHDIFIFKIASLYLNPSHNNLSQLQKLQPQNSEITLSLIDKFMQILTKLESNRVSIHNWNQNGEILLHLLKIWQENGKHPDIKHLITYIGNRLDVTKKKDNDELQRFIWEMTVYYKKQMNQAMIKSSPVIM